MKDLLNNPWVVGGLCVLAAITVYFRLFDSQSSSSTPPVEEAPVVVAAPAPVQPPPVPSPAPVPPVDSTTSQVPIVGTWIDTITRDPFRRQDNAQEGSSADPLPGLIPESLAEDGSHPLLASDQALRLQAIFVNGSNRIAVINSVFVKVGDQVGEFRVSHIKPDGVWLQGATEKHWVEFGPRQTREPVS